MKVSIKKATLKDLQNIQKLNLMLFEKEKKEYNPLLNLNWTYGNKGTKYFKDSIENDLGLCLVAKIDDKIVGYLIGWIKKEKNPSLIINKQAELENMFVLDEFRNNKIGYKLVEYFLEWAKDNKVENIQVTANSQNIKAINFYKKFEFKDFSNTLQMNLE